MPKSPGKQKPTHSPSKKISLNDLLASLPHEERLAIETLTRRELAKLKAAKAKRLRKTAAGAK
jgi:archaellum component FlaD/FlaE